MILTNAKIITHDDVFVGTVEVHAGRIRAVSEGLSTSPAAIDLEGDWLIPGLIEIHTDNLEKHLMPRPGVLWDGESAFRIHDAQLACSGITTAFDGVVIGDIEASTPRGRFLEISLAAIHALADSPMTRCEHLLHLRCELANHDVWDHYAALVDNPRVQLISLMDHTPGQRQWENIEQARTYYTGKKGWSAEKFERQVAHAATLQAQYAEPHRAYFVDYCRTHGISLASHDDTTVAHVEQAHAEGAAMSEFPTTLAAAQAAHERGLLTVMGGPNVVRGGSHSGNVAAADLARRGLLDILSSDYVPGSLLSAVMRLVQDDILPLPQAVATVTHNPARAAGMLDRGVLAQGLRADLVQVHMAELPDGGRQAVVRGVWREGQRVL